MGSVRYFLLIDVFILLLASSERTKSSKNKRRKMMKKRGWWTTSKNCVDGWKLGTKSNQSWKPDLINHRHRTLAVYVLIFRFLLQQFRFLKGKGVG